MSGKVHISAPQPGADVSHSVLTHSARLTTCSPVSKGRSEPARDTPGVVTRQSLQLTADLPAGSLCAVWTGLKFKAELR